MVFRWFWGLSTIGFNGHGPLVQRCDGFNVSFTSTLGNEIVCCLNQGVGNGLIPTCFQNKNISMNSLKCKKNHLKTILGGLFLSRYNPPYGCWVGVQQVEEFFFFQKSSPWSNLYLNPAMKPSTTSIMSLWTRCGFSNNHFDT